MSKTSPELERAMAEALASVERVERQAGDPEDPSSANPGPPSRSVDVVPEVELGAANSASPAAAAEEPTKDWPAEVASLKDQLLRMAADFDNFRKRARREREEQRQMTTEEVLRSVLPVLDNLERAIAAAPGDSSDPVIQGVRMVVKQFSDALSSYGVVSASSLGQPFDPERHEAMAQEVRDGVIPGTILVELERGYSMGDRLLRAAKVVVAGVPSAGRESNST